MYVYSTSIDTRDTNTCVKRDECFKIDTYVNLTIP